jgi:hypothetical protein
MKSIIIAAFCLLAGTVSAAEIKVISGGRPAPPGHTRSEGRIHRRRRRVSDALFQRVTILPIISLLKSIREADAFL